MRPTLIELQAEAYRNIVQIEAWQKRLKETNDLIANFKEEPDPRYRVTEVKKEDVPEVSAKL